MVRWYSEWESLYSMSNRRLALYRLCELLGLLAEDTPVIMESPVPDAEGLHRETQDAHFRTSTT